MHINIDVIFSKYILYVCIYIYIYIHNIHYVNEKIILDVINRLTALICIKMRFQLIYYNY